MKKAIDIERFFGLDSGNAKAGRLFDSDGVTVLSGGGLKSLLAAREIDVGESPSLEGVYSYYSYVDSDYEIKTTADWVYKNICPSSVLNYGKGLTAASRILVADVGKAGKTNGGYRNVLAAYSAGEKLYVLYDAVYNIIDQRRSDEYSVLGTGYMITFDGKTSSVDETRTTVCTLTQVWLDVIDKDKVSSFLVDAVLVSHGNLGSTYAKSRLVAKKDKIFKYTSTEYAPDLGTSYTLYPDKVYTEIYPVLATDYPTVSAFSDRERHFVRYFNRDGDGSLYGSAGEKLILLPEMRLLTNSGGEWALEAASDTIPMMEGAVQHSDRLFGYYGGTLYASVSGNCADYTMAVGNLPATDGFSTVTSDEGGYTAIVSFDEKVVAFTEQSMMTVSGSGLPFSLSYEGKYGCKSSQALTVCGGYLYFASHGGIYRYSGSRVECISGVLPHGFLYEEARLTSYRGMVAVHLMEHDGLYIYNPESDSWTRQKKDGIDTFFSDGSGQYAFYSNNGSKLYRLFSDKSDFSFAVSVGGGERKRICTVTFCADIGDDGSIFLTDEEGNILIEVDGIYGDYGKRVTRSCPLRNKYCDTDNIYFRGSGDVTLLSLRIEYLPITNRLRHIK